MVVLVEPPEEARGLTKKEENKEEGLRRLIDPLLKKLIVIKEPGPVGLMDSFSNSRSTQPFNRSMALSCLNLVKRWVQQNSAL
jgi:hypothetical protein